MDLFQIKKEFGTPVFLYNEESLILNAKKFLDFDFPYGKTIRYAMKANPNRNILKLFDSLGVFIDASSGFEAERAILAGIDARKILLTAQELPENLQDLVNKGIEFNACSLHQLECYGRLFPGTEVSIRINPGKGSGFHSKTNVAGSEAGFGIWHEKIPEAKKIIEKYALKVIRIHTHIGSGTNPDEWKEVAKLSIAILNEFKDATILNLGGGFKVARMPEENDADITAILTRIAEKILEFHKQTGRKIRLEFEPGTFLVANAGFILSTIQDITETDKYKFLKLDSGMTEIIRPSLYGAEHFMEIFSQQQNSEKEQYVVIGHCCETGDLLSVEKNHGDSLKPRLLGKASIGDLLLIHGCGAYCSSMSTKNYNSFPEAAEVMILRDGNVKLIRKKQSIDQIIENETIE